MAATKFLNRGNFANWRNVLRRHGVLRFSRYLTVRKMMNGLHIAYEHSRGEPRPKARPFALRLETTNLCNLRCPGCPTGNQANELPSGFMSFDKFKRVIDSLADHLVLLRLDGIGEPTLNPDLWRQIEYAHQKGIGTQISSHLGTIKPADIPKVVDSGLDYLICSIDGTTQDVYKQYRKGGDLDRVLEKLRAILDYRKASGRKNPFIEFQFIRFPHNAHQEDAARELAEALGVDRFLSKADGGVDLDSMGADPATAEARQIRLRKSTCYWPWYLLTLNWSTGVNLCCISLAKDVGLPDYDPEDFYASWHHPRLVSTRELLAHRITPQEAAARDWTPPCVNCSLYGFVPAEVLRAKSPAAAAKELAPQAVLSSAEK
jgi:hypothetical protein